jgi:hypothetical protein
MKAQIVFQCPLLAQSGLAELVSYLSAFGAKRTWAVVRLRPPRSRLTQIGSRTIPPAVMQHELFTA